MSCDGWLARRGWLGAVAFWLAACGGGGDATSPNTGGSGSGGKTTTPATVSAVSGSGQTGAAGAALSSPFTVRVSTASGAPVAGVTVGFQVTSGTATLSPTTAVTDATGQASTQVTLGTTAGAVQVTATVQGTTLSTTFAATIGTLSASCNASSALSMTPGQVSTTSGTSVCITGSAGAEYALIPFNGSADYRSRVGFTVQPSGIDAPTTLADRVPFRDASASAAASTSGFGATPANDFGARLRERRRPMLTPLIPAARAWYAQGAPGSGVRRSTIPATVTVGQIVTLNANNGDDGCTAPSYHAARVQAIGSRAIAIADTLNPAGGYTTAEYQSIAATFDTIIDPVDRRNFGDPSDIDHNGHVILFFTSAVNALTPRNSSSFVGGFFDSRDLFPLKGTATLEGCAGSNLGEMFYLLVPDPGGVVNGNRFSKSFVTTLTLSTVAHEYQHLINASRRVYVNTSANALEDTWLDEGLAHIAEELFFYARTGLGPRQNLDAPTLRSSSTRLNLFADDASANFDRLELFLQNPQRNSPYADNDSLETRGATWSFLRYAADQRATTAQETIWQRLANSTTTGMGTLQLAFGSDLPTLFRDWATSLIADDVAGVDPRYQMLSWNLRSVFGLVDPGYPLQTVTLTNGSPTTTLVSGGSAAYLRFAVGAGKTAALAWNALPATLQVTVVRLR